MRKENFVKQQEYVLLSEAAGHQGGLPTPWRDDVGGRVNKTSLIEHKIILTSCNTDNIIQFR